MADLPAVECVLVPVGGGGLASGVASAVKALRAGREGGRRASPNWPGTRRRACADGSVAIWPTEQTYRTAADGLRTNLSELTFRHLRERLCDGIITVSEDDILDDGGRAGPVGPAGGGAERRGRAGRLAAAPRGAAGPLRRHRRRDRRAVISGGNIAGPPGVLIQGGPGLTWVRRRLAGCDLAEDPGR